MIMMMKTETIDCDDSSCEQGWYCGHLSSLQAGGKSIVS